MENLNVCICGKCGEVVICQHDLLEPHEETICGDCSGEREHYPIGGMIEHVDIEREKDLVNEALRMNEEKD